MNPKWQLNWEKTKHANVKLAKVQVSTTELSYHNKQLQLSDAVISLGSTSTCSNRVIDPFVMEVVEPIFTLNQSFYNILISIKAFSEYWGERRLPSWQDTGDQSEDWNIDSLWLVSLKGYKPCQQNASRSITELPENLQLDECSQSASPATSTLLRYWK